VIATAAGGVAFAFAFYAVVFLAPAERRMLRSFVSRAA
jgi:hypothetical protein